MLDLFVSRKNILEQNPTCRIKLKCIPFYFGLDERLRTIPETETIILPTEMPCNGLNEIELEKRTVFIKQKSVPISFFEFLGCITCKAADLYIYHILPYFNAMQATDMLHHLIYIKNTVIPQLSNNSNEENAKQMNKLRGLLRNVAFIPVGINNRLACACNFFNPHKDIFKLENQLCCSSDLPPPPYNEKEWEVFLVHCGMKSEMTPDIFLELANRLESFAKEHGVSQMVKDNSIRMVKILFTDLKLPETIMLSRIQHARFLIPKEICEDLLTLAPQFVREGKLLSFHETTLPSNKHLVWTVMDTISDNISDVMCRANITVAVEELEFYESPPLNIVLDHTEILCNSIIKKNILRICAKNAKLESLITRIMDQIYTYLQKNSRVDSVNRLKSIPFIFIKEKTMFVKPEQVVLDINKDDEIPPYLCKASLYFGQFHSLFEKYGAAKSLTCDHLAKVLCEIQKTSKGNILEPNEIACTKKAVQILFSKLKTEHAEDLNVSALYLPSKNNTLIKSSALVFIDDRMLEDRIGDNMPEVDFFIGFKELDMKVYDPVSEVSKLQEKHRPRLLSKVVIEQLDPDCKQNIIPSVFAKKLQIFLHSKEFLAGICRLIRDEHYKNDIPCGEEIEIEIQNKLQSVEAKCVEHLTTIMMYKSKILANTSERSLIFASTEKTDLDVQKLCIYFSSSGIQDESSLIKRFAKLIAISLNGYLGKPLKDNQMHLPDIIKCINAPNEIEIELDFLRICKIEANVVSKFLPFMPELGTEIPIALHYLLDNSCTYLDPGEYVAYELYDPIIDEDDVNETDPVYILAKVLETNGNRDTNSNAKEWSMSYILDIGGESPIEVLASKVYKFIRNYDVDKSIDVTDGAEVFSWNIDRVKSYIRDVLKNAFLRGNREFKRTLKRILLQYHPDKHKDNKEYFNDLTLFIYFVRKRLENGEPVNDAAMSNFNKKEDVPKSNFTVTVLERGTRHVRNQESSRQTDDYFSPFFIRGSQPGQARRWYRQAEYDLQASKSDKHQPGAYNWACYKCHQSAEKALKALLYQIDADQVVQVHRLSALTTNINDSELSTLAIRLEGVTGNYFQMRYPDAVSSGDGMRIPSDLYNAANAQEAIELAGEILQRVRSKIPNL